MSVTENKKLNCSSQTKPYLKEDDKTRKQSKANIPERRYHKN